MKQTIRSWFLVIALFLPGMVGLGSTVATNAGCTHQEAKAVVSDALDAAQIACIIASQFTDESAVMEACAIERRLAPLVQVLMAQKAQAKKAAACMPEDAGKTDAK